MRTTTHLLTIASSLYCVPPLVAQSTIVGVDLRRDQVFLSTTDSFVGDFTDLSPESRSLFAIDFDATGSTLYAIDAASFEIITIDPTTGATTPTGTVASGLAGVTGLTAAPDGVTWFASGTVGPDTFLYRGDIVTGAFTQLGLLEPGGITIDIAMNGDGKLFGLSISSDSLLSIDTGTGAGTVLGPIGLNANFAQGMDFDWSNDTLYATVYTGDGTGHFCSLDLVTGAANLLENTFPLNAEMEMAVRRGGSDTLGAGYCTATPNSTGATGLISASGSALVGDNLVILTASDLPPNSFGFFLASQTQGFTANPGGSSGNLCLDGEIGRYVGPGQVGNTGTAGTFSLALDLTAMPTPTGPMNVQIGESWSFQAWHRDLNGGTAASNFTTGLEVQFR
ncbi:MAG: hypothetical protein AAF726_00940 [Planctomycetota bacterium]